jgi:hypothetical protein
MHPSRRRSWLAQALTAVGLSLLIVSGTCWLTLLRPGFASSSIKQVNGFERLYSDVLPDPSIQLLLKRELRPLPFDTTYVTANLRLFMPPDVLARVLTRLQGQYVAVLTGRAQSIDAVRCLQPVIDQAVRVLSALAPGLIAQAPRVNEASLATFSAAFERYLSEVRAGRIPARLPNVALNPALAGNMATVLTDGLDRRDRATLRTELEGLLTFGDLTSALAAVLPYYLAGQLPEALNLDLTAAAASLSATTSHAIPDVNGLGVPVDIRWLTPAGALLLLAGLALAAVRTSSPRRELTRTLLLGLGFTLLAGVALRLSLPDPVLRAASSARAGSPQHQLLVDVDQQLRSSISETFLILLTLSLLAGAVCSLVGHDNRVGLRQRRTLVTATSTGLLAATAVALVAFTSDPIRACNGQARLCELRYDEATYLTSHNAMASSAREFFNADQDPDLTGQLDNGVRALMLDLHTWTSPPDLQRYVRGLDGKTRTALAPLLRPLTAREGVWLCHVVCQLGADPAVPQLRSVGAWMRAHPDDVVTLILEDHVSEDLVRQTVADAGLSDLLSTPPTGSQPWPTLGAMVRSNHRLVVFVERATPSSGWLRNLYTYTAETPYDAPTTASLNCRPGRGRATAPLFLLNNWISTPAPGRAAAAQVNARTFLQQRIATCAAVRRMHPTYVAVNFAQSGEALAAVDTLNLQAISSRNGS